MFRSQGIPEPGNVRPRVRLVLHRCAVLLMMAAAMAFSLQGASIATPETAAPKNGQQHRSQSHGAFGSHKRHVVAHVHADGTLHRHAVDGEDGGLARHTKEPGSASTAPATAVLPSPSGFVLAVVASIPLAIEPATACRGTEPEGPRKPPRTPSIV